MDAHNTIKAHRLLLAILALLAISGPLYAEDTGLVPLNGDSGIVYHPMGLEKDARKVLGLLSESNSEVRKALGISLDYRPGIVLVTNRDAFIKAVGSENISAYALPQKGLIVMDYTRVLKKPFTLKGTLKHELVHLVLGRHMGETMPKWLNEGVAQLVAESTAEIALSRNTSFLSGAVLSDRLIPLSDMELSFPRTNRGMVLAYEESLSFVRFLDDKYGRDALLKILGQMRKGRDVTVATKNITGQDLDRLETQWQHQLKTKASWLSYLSSQFYELLFMLAAVITVYGFLRVIIRIRSYRDDDDDDFPPVQQDY